MQDPPAHILIAEDNAPTRDLIMESLKARGHIVWGAIDGESGIKVVRERRIDLAIVDLNMSPTGGFDFIKYLLSYGFDIPVVLVTADDATDVLRVASDLKVRQIMQKPIDMGKLLQVAERILKSSRPRQV